MRESRAGRVPGSTGPRGAVVGISTPWLTPPSATSTGPRVQRGRRNAGDARVAPTTPQRSDDVAAEQQKGADPQRDRRVGDERERRSFGAHRGDSPSPLPTEAPRGGALG